MMDGYWFLFRLFLVGLYELLILVNYFKDDGFLKFFLNIIYEIEVVLDFKW